MNLRVEVARIEDADIIFRQAKQLVRCYEDPSLVDLERVEEWMRKKIHSCIHSYQRILRDGITVGYFRLEDQPERTELDDFYILPEYRGCGIGAQVLQYCLENAKHPIYFYVFCKNHRAISFYQRYGFEITSRVSETRVIMAQKVDS